MNENELNELAELLRELEETLLTLQATNKPERRSLLVRKISRLFAEIERNPSAFGMLDTIRGYRPCGFQVLGNATYPALARRFLWSD